MHFVAQTRHPWKATGSRDIRLSHDSGRTKSAIGSNALDFDGAAFYVPRHPANEWRAALKQSYLRPSGGFPVVYLYWTAEAASSILRKRDLHVRGIICAGEPCNGHASTISSDRWAINRTSICLPV